MYANFILTKKIYEHIGSSQSISVTPQSGNNINKEESRHDPLRLKFQTLWQEVLWEHWDGTRMKWLSQTLFGQFIYTTQRM
jgi:hypothetical protein